MRERRSRSLQALGLRKVTLVVPERCAMGLRQFACELRARHEAASAQVTPLWRTLSPSAQVLVNPECRARCAIRDTRAGGADRFHWSITVLGAAHPIAAGRAGELAEAQALAEMVLGNYAADWCELSRAGHTDDG